MKKKMKEVGRVALNVVCIIAGMAIAGFGFKNLLPKKQYSKSEITEKE